MSINKFRRWLYVTAYGRSTGNCGCCGRALTDPISVENGIGPICESKWGL